MGERVGVRGASRSEESHPLTPTLSPEYGGEGVIQTAVLKPAARLARAHRLRRGQADPPVSRKIRYESALFHPVYKTRALRVKRRGTFPVDLKPASCHASVSRPPAISVEPRPAPIAEKTSPASPLPRGRCRPARGEPA